MGISRSEVPAATTAVVPEMAFMAVVMEVVLMAGTVAGNRREEGRDEADLTISTKNRLIFS